MGDRLKAMKKWDRFDLDGTLCFFKYHHHEPRLWGGELVPVPNPFLEYSRWDEIGILCNIDYDKAAAKVEDGTLVPYGEGEP